MVVFDAVVGFAVVADAAGEGVGLAGGTADEDPRGFAWVLAKGLGDELVGLVVGGGAEFEVSGFGLGVLPGMAEVGVLVEVLGEFLEGEFALEEVVIELWGMAGGELAEESAEGECFVGPRVFFDGEGDVEGALRGRGVWRELTGELGEAFA